jgi:hypothetical protein
MAHTFTLTPLRTHFSKTPNPAGANRLIDLPGDTFLDTDDEIHVIAGALWTLSVKYDKVDEKDRPKDVDGLRKVSGGGRSNSPYWSYSGRRQLGIQSRFASLGFDEQRPR